MNTIFVKLFCLTIICSNLVSSLTVQRFDLVGQSIDPITYTLSRHIHSVNESQIRWFSSAPTPQLSSTGYTRLQQSNYYGPHQIYSQIDVSGTFNTNAYRVISIMLRDNSMVMSEVNYLLGNIVTYNLPFHPDLISLIHNCVHADIHRDDPLFNKYITDLFELYKPGVISNVMIGGKLLQRSFVKNSYYRNTQYVLTAATKSNKYSHLFNYAQNDDFINNIFYRDNYELGGNYSSSISLTQWMDSVQLFPSILDYTVATSLYWLQPTVWPDFPAKSIQRILDSYTATYNAYYSNNTHLGCSDIYSSNFELNVTVNANCKYDYVSTSSFGGTYNTYEFNPVTGQYSCPVNSLGHRYSFNDTFYVDCYYANTSGPAFGGFYQNMPNPVTGTFSCPMGTYHLQGWCFGFNTLSSTFGGIFRTYLGECFGTNLLSGVCGCPSYSPNYYLLSNDSGIETFACIYAPNFTLGYQPGMIYARYSPVNYNVTHSLRSNHNSTYYGPYIALLVVIVVSFSVITCGLIIALAIYIYPSLLARYNRQNYSQFD
jgi:hypothetical protein